MVTSGLSGRYLRQAVIHQAQDAFQTPLCRQSQHLGHQRHFAAVYGLLHSFRAEACGGFGAHVVASVPRHFVNRPTVQCERDL